jgi:glycosyltransferase involved in cell wall biosynthesis
LRLAESRRLQFAPSLPALDREVGLENPRRAVSTVAVLYADGGSEVDAIREYSRRLVEALTDTGAVYANLQLGALSRVQGDAVVLQYNPFSYGRWGFAPHVPIALARLRLGQRRVRIAVMVHEAYVPMEGLRWTLMGAWQRLQLLAIRLSADVILVSSGPLAHSLTRLRPLRPTHHLPVASNLPDRRSQRLRSRRALGASPDTLVLTAFGTGHPSRSLDFVAAAADALSLASRDILVLNLGAGAPAVRGLDPSIRVHAPGVSSPEELASALAATDIYLAPFMDGVSTRRTTVMAALQHGLPIVGTDGDLTDDLMRSSLLLTPAGRPDLFAAAVSELAADDRARAEAGARARRLYEQFFDWTVVANRLLHTLDLNET